MELFNPDLFNDQITIIGAGATGSWLALMLAKLGIKGNQINVWDFDDIEEHNIPNQSFDIGQVGKNKADAMYHNVLQSTGTGINARGIKFDQRRLSGYVFLMVDSMAERKRIWETSVMRKSAIKLMVEPRMGLDVGRVYNVDPMSSAHIKKYNEAFYTDEEAEVSACGASQTVITTAVNIASLCATQFINHVNHSEADVELDNEILIDYKYNNLIANKW